MVTLGSEISTIQPVTYRNYQLKDMKEMCLSKRKQCLRQFLPLYRIETD